MMMMMMMMMWQLLLLLIIIIILIINSICLLCFVCPSGDLGHGRFSVRSMLGGGLVIARRAARRFVARQMFGSRGCEFMVLRVIDIGRGVGGRPFMTFDGWGHTGVYIVAVGFGQYPDTHPTNDVDTFEPNPSYRHNSKNILGA